MRSTGNSYYSSSELHDIGFAELGENVLISRKCSIYDSARIKIGHNVRVDDFCILSGSITIGSHVHIAPYCGLFGGGGIKIHDFVGFSARVSIYSTSDDYSGVGLTNPTIAIEFRVVKSAPVDIKRHAILGCGAVVLPGVTIGEGAAVGAQSLATGDLEAWKIYAGIPARPLRERSRELLVQESAFLAQYQTSK